MSVNKLNLFQDQVSELVLRHRSLLDILSKYHQASASVHRSVSKSVTECGCIELHAKKQNYEENVSLEEASQSLQSHIDGEPCEQCRDVITSELGRNLFYMTALCNALDIDLEDVVEKESAKCATLGLFNMS